MKYRKKNILFLAHSFEIGGVQIINKQLLEGIDKKKFNVFLLYIKKGPLYPSNSDKVIHEKLGNTVNLRSPLNLLYLFKIINFIKKNNIDIINTIDPISYILGAVAAKISHIKHIRIQPNLLSNEKLNYKTFRISPFEKWTDKFIVLNRKSSISLQERGVNTNKIKILYGFTNLPALKSNITSNIRYEYDIPNFNSIVVTIHRLVENKGLEKFLEMIPHVVKDIKDVTFLIVGDGPLKSILLEKAKNLNIEKYVCFTGMREDTLDISRQSTIGVYPTGNTAGMINMLRAGKLIVSKKGSLMEEYIIKENHDLLSTHDDPEEYASIVKRMLRNKNELAKKETKQLEFIKEHLNGEKNLNTYEKILYDLADD